MSPNNRGPEWLVNAMFSARSDEILRAVTRCPDRGPVLPVSRQPGCGCAELTDCRAAGAPAAGVCLTQCLACRATSLGLGPEPPAPGTD
jgi:hypothetical protein